MYTGFIPIYLLYNFILNIYFYLDNFEISFDEGIIKNYYPDFFGLTDLGYVKLNLYFQKLIFEKSDYKFCNPILYQMNNIYPNNWVFFEKFNIEHESIFNNIRYINKKIKPKFRV